jgi:hypothetical protein
MPLSQGIRRGELSLNLTALGYGLNHYSQE